MHVGMELVQERDFSATLTQDEFTRNLNPLPTPTQLYTARQKKLSIEDIQLRQFKPGKLWWLATVSRRESHAMLVRLASRVNSSPGGDVNRINVLVKTAKAWQEAAILT